MAAASTLRSLSLNIRGSVENVMRPKRSDWLRLFRQNDRARRSCSIFSPAIEPEVSATKITSFAIVYWAFTSIEGESTSTKLPSPPVSTCESIVAPIGSDPSPIASTKSRSAW